MKYEVILKDGFAYRYRWVGFAETVSDAVKTAMQTAAMGGALSSDIIRDRWPTLPVTITVLEAE